LSRRREACSGVVVGAWAGVSWREGRGGCEEDAPALERRKRGLVKVMMSGKIGMKRRSREKYVCSWLISSISCDIEGIWLEC